METAIKCFQIHLDLELQMEYFKYFFKCVLFLVLVSAFITYCIPFILFQIIL